MQFDGVLVIDKPSGPTSHDVVARVRRVLKITRVGHTGTLDPLATGVLPLVIGRATRLASLMSSDRKSYEADVRLGCATASYDAAGGTKKGSRRRRPGSRPSSRWPRRSSRFAGPSCRRRRPTRRKRSAASRRIGWRGATSPLSLLPSASPSTSWTCSDSMPAWSALRLTTSAGFYVRSLAHDLGQALGCGAHLEALAADGSRASSFWLSRSHWIARG